MALSSTPEIGLRRVDEAALVAQAGLPVACQQQRCVEIDELGALGEQHRRRHRQRTADHAADHDAEPLRARSGEEPQSLGQPAGLVELDVDVLVAPGERRQIGTGMAGFIGAERHRVRQLGESISATPSSARAGP